MPAKTTRNWAFEPHLRRKAVGRPSRPAVIRVREAVAEIRRVARKAPLAGAEGAVLFLTRVSPALADVDGSSGAIFTAVRRAVDALAPVVAAAPADEATRDGWLEQLWQAVEDDEALYLDSVGNHWGELCGSPEVASAWADLLLDETRAALGLHTAEQRYYPGTQACLSALFHAGRHDELLALLAEQRFWPYKRWAADALVLRGRKSEALRAAESCRQGWRPEPRIDLYCEALLLSSGLAEEAYRRYGLSANRSRSRPAWLRALVRKYPHKPEAEILADLEAATPEEKRAPVPRRRGTRSATTRP